MKNLFYKEFVCVFKRINLIVFLGKFYIPILLCVLDRVAHLSYININIVSTIFLTYRSTIVNPFFSVVQKNKRLTIGHSDYFNKLTDFSNIFPFTVILHMDFLVLDYL